MERPSFGAREASPSLISLPACLIWQLFEDISLAFLFMIEAMLAADGNFKCAARSVCNGV